MDKLLRQMFISLFSLFPFLAYGQCDTCYIEYHNIAHEAEYLLYERKSIKRACHLLKKAIKLVPEPYTKDIFNLTKCFALQNNPKKTLKFLKKMEYEIGSSIYILMERDSAVFSKVFQKKIIKSFYIEQKKNLKMIL